LNTSPPPTFNGRAMDITMLTFLQVLTGVIHVFFGFLLLFASKTAIDTGQSSSTIHSVYTVGFGFAATIFAYGIWIQKKLGIYGPIALSMFVISVDLLTILNLPSIPGVPKFAAGPRYCTASLSFSICFKLRSKLERAAPY